MRKVFIRRYVMIKSRFAKLILDGVKTTTIRLGRVIPKCKEIIIHSNGRPIAEARIKNVIYKKVRELTEEDAKRDGYQSLQELLDDLRKIYGTEISPDNEVTIIEFSIIRKFDDIHADDIYLGFSPYTIALLANRYIRDALTDEEKTIVENILKYKSIRATAIKLFRSLEKRWIIRRALRKILMKLIDKGIIGIDKESIERLAMVSNLWRRYIVQQKDKYSQETYIEIGDEHDRERGEKERGEKDEEAKKIGRT